MKKQKIYKKHFRLVSTVSALALIAAATVPGTLAQTPNVSAPHEEEPSAKAPADAIQQNEPLDAAPQVDETAVQVNEIKELVSVAAGVTLNQWDQFVRAREGKQLPGEGRMSPELRLTFVLLRIPYGKDDKAREEFRSLASGEIGFAETAKEITRNVSLKDGSRVATGPVSLIQEDRITKVTVGFGDTADVVRGTVAFEIPDQLAGTIHYVARRDRGQWRIDEFSLPVRGVKIALDANKKWRVVEVEKEGATEATDLAALQGKWKIEKAEEAGQPADQMVGLIYTIEGNTLSIELPRPGRINAIFKIDPTKDPKQLSFTIVDEAGEEVINNLIYSVEGDTLQLAGIWNSLPGLRKAFPKAFETEEGNNLSYLTVLKRVDAAAPAEPTE